MISRIDSIKDFGIYKNFAWPTTAIRDFNLKNLIYGWNYSGKTTLSRIFSSLRDKKIHSSYENATFIVNTTAGVFTSANLENFPYEILVFNSDYIKDNLNFSFHQDTITDSKTIFFEVGDNAKYEVSIKDLKNKINAINGTDILKGKKFGPQKEIDEFESYDRSNTGKFTILAKEIKDEHFLSLINFTKAQVKPIISYVKENLNGHIVSDKKLLSYLNDIVKVSEPKNEIVEIQINSEYVGIFEHVNNILGKTPEKSVLSKILDTNSEAYIWVKKGVEFHKPKEACLFCDNTVTKERIDFLNSYFTSQASLLKEEVDKAKEKIADELKRFEDAGLPLSNNDFNLGFDREYAVLKKQYDKTLGVYRKYLKTVNIKLDNKISKSLYLKADLVEPFKIDILNSLIEKMNNVILANNKFSNQFNEKIEIERNKLKNHLVSKFLKTEKYFAKEKRYMAAKASIEALNKKVEGYEKEILRYESLKESDKEGAQQYTYFVQSFLNRTDIEIELDEKTKKFVLLRDKGNASNLSEGEKTAIAFSHFLVSIKALQSKSKFQDVIVFIDDPISSLDGNHIFQINSLLKEIFFSQVADPNNPKQKSWKMNCHQFFMSTHSFEFLNLLKELPKSSIGYDYIKDEKKRKESRYFIERRGNESFINNIPEIFDDYKSEYHFLFSEIVKFDKDPHKNTSEKLLIMPNILRRFVEMYTLTKYPSKDEVDDRANEIFGKVKSKRILKPFHYFSHFNNIDRIGKHSELLVDVEKSCSTLLEVLKEDTKHFEALTKAMN